MKRCFIHISLQRCGCHALSNWLLKQRQGYKEAQLEPIGGGIYTLSHQSNPIYLFNHQDLSKTILEQRSKAINNLEFPCDVMISVENGNILQYHEPNFIQDIFEGYEIIRIISLRDVWNCYASFYKKYFVVDSHITSRWEERAEEILCKTNYLKENFLFINYNKWFSSKDYRVSLCKDLGLFFTDGGIDDVPSFGNGSSFEQRTKHGMGSSMNVLSRYKEFEDDRRFLSYITPYRQKLSKEIFKYEHRPDE